MLQSEAVFSWRDRWDRFEAAVGLCAAFVLAFGPLTVAAFTLLFALFLAEWKVAAVAAAVTAVTCPMALWLAKMAESALSQFRSEPVPETTADAWPWFDDPTVPQRKTPFAIVLASTLPPLPLVARVPLAVWWLAHFLAGAALVVFLDVVAQQVLMWPGLKSGIPAVVFAYLFQFAANLFLILSVAALFDSPMTTVSVWRNRFVIDALFTLPLVVRMLL